MVKCSDVLQCNGGTSNKLSNIIIRHIDNRKLLLICKAKISPVTGLQWPRGFQEVKVPRFHDNGTGWW